MNNLNIPVKDETEFLSLPKRIRDEVKSWIISLRQVENAKPILPAVQRICVSKKVSRATVYKKLRDYQIFGWRGLINRAKWPSNLPSASNDAFLLFLYRLWLANNKHFRNTHLQLLAIWKHSAPIPGYGETPRKSPWNDCPDGWTYENIVYHIKTFIKNYPEEDAAFRQNHQPPPAS